MKKILALLAAMGLCASSLFAMDEYRTGSMIFSFKAGTSMPAFIHFFGEADGLEDRKWWGEGEDATKLYWGGYFALGFERFTSSKLSLGGELGYDFNYCVNDDLFTVVPLTFKTTWYPIQGKVDTPISFGIGTAYERFGTDKSMLNLNLNLTAGLNLYFWEHWGIGVQTGLWVVPEFNYNDGESENDGVIGFMPILLTVQYRNQ